MVKLSDVKPLFHAARVFGCAPHLVTSSDLLLTKPGLVYSGLCALGFLCCGAYGVYLIARDVGASQPTIMALTMVRTLLAYVCFFADGVLTMRLNGRLRSALLLLRNFDTAVNYEQGRPLDRRIRARCWALVAAVVGYWVLVGYVTFEFFSSLCLFVRRCERTNPLFNAITYVIANAAISMQLIKFAGMLLLLRQRFRYLRKLLEPEAFVLAGHAIPESSCTLTATRRREYQLQDVWWLHCSLSDAGDIVNSVYSTQLLLWIATMWLNALSRIYNINDSIVSPEQFLLKLREALLVTACLASLLLITAACHFTALDANLIGKCVFMPHCAAVLRKRNHFEYNVEIGMYFNLRKLQFSAAGGFMQIDLPLLLSIAAAMTTYLVVLHNNS